MSYLLSKFKMFGLIKLVLWPFVLGGVSGYAGEALSNDAIQAAQIESLKQEIEVLRSQLADFQVQLGSQQQQIIKRDQTISQIVRKEGQNTCLYAGSYKLCVQVDGNAVVYHSTGSVSWDAKSTYARIDAKLDRSTGGNQCVQAGTHSLCMQSDGNLVVYNGSRAVWSSWDTIRSNPAGNVSIRAGSCSWALQSDGNFVRYGCGPVQAWR